MPATVGQQPYASLVRAAHPFRPFVSPGTLEAGSKRSMAKIQGRNKSAPRRRPIRREGIGVAGFLIRGVLLLTLGAGLALALYGVHLDKVVRAKFEGKRWALPARVYARPLEIYAGRSLTVAELAGELARLGYREDPRLSRAGSFHIAGDRAEIRTRARHHLKALSSRLPSSSIRSASVPRNISAGSMSSSVATANGLAR